MASRCSRSSGMLARSDAPQFHDHERAGRSRSGRARGGKHGRNGNRPPAAAAGVAQRGAGRLLDDARRIVLRGRAAAGADPGEHRPHHRHLGLPAAVPAGRPARRDRATGRYAGRSQLRSWRQRLVAVLGLERAGGPAGDASEPARDRGDRLRRARPHLGDPGTARRLPRHDPCPRPDHRDHLGRRHRRMDARFAGRPIRRRRAGLCDGVGRDGAGRLQDAPRLSRPAGHAGRMGRPVCGNGRDAACRPAGGTDGPAGGRFRSL